MKLIAVVAGLVVLASVTGCATKNYGRQGELTGYERDMMNCREIDLEAAKVHGFLSHVEKESQFDGRSVLSFLGDFGVGNLMEKSSAVDSATARLAQLQELRSRRGCGADSVQAVRGPAQPSGPVNSSRTEVVAAASGTPAQKLPRFGRYNYEAENLPEVRACNPYPPVSLVAQGPGFESFTVPCVNGDAVSVRCESGGCRVLR